ncbi:hypothetical protein EDC04DRAFT_2901721 [Pisolithus marmoratus]|nr:hypothetical protein EDC04DRAFT_2901721 [Pisolithus marmoratus]
MSESSDRRVPRVNLCLMVVSNNKNLNTSTLFLAKFLNGTTPASDHASDNGLNLTEDAALAQTSAYPSRILTFNFQPSHTSTLFLAKFLDGTTPASDHASDNGLNLTEDAALAQTSAYPSRILTFNFQPSRRHTVVDATDFMEAELGAISTTLTKRQIQGFITFETILLTRTYLGGKRCTLAGITAASVIFLSLFHSLDALLHAGQPNIPRHLDFTSQLEPKEVFGQPTFVEKAVWDIPPEKPRKQRKMIRKIRTLSLRNPNPWSPIAIDVRSRALETHLFLTEHAGPGGSP